MEAGANLENYISIEYGKDVSCTIYQHCKNCFNSSAMEYLAISHSPSNHKQFPQNVRDAIVW